MEKSKMVLLDEKLETERKEISQYIFDNIINKLNNINVLADTQVHIASQRQRLIDKISDLKSILRRRNEKNEQIKKQKYRFYKLDYDIKLSDYEIKRFVDADMEEINNINQIIEIQLDYYKQTVDTLDKTLYKIKYLIETKKFLSGGF
jgi:hypothetical protein